MNLHRILSFCKTGAITIALLLIGSFSYAADLSVRENAGQLEFQIDFLSGATCQRETGCSVTILSQDGTAKAGIDFKKVEQNVRWARGDGSAKFVLIQVYDNADKDGTKTFTLNSIDPLGLNQTGSRSVEIIDDESSVFRNSANGIVAPSEEVGDVIDAVCPQIQGDDQTAEDTIALRRDCNALVNASQNNDPNINAALVAIAPDQAGASVNVGRQSVKNQIKNVSSRLSAVRSRTTNSLAGLTLNLDDQAIAIADLFPASGAGAGDDGLMTSAINFFINGELSFGNRDDTTREEGYDFGSYGLTAGADYRLNQNWVIGGALGYTLASSDFSSGGTLESNGILATVFSSHQVNEFYFEGGASIGSSSYDQKRKIQYSLADGTNVNQVVSSSFGGTESSLFFNTGAQVLLSNRMTLTPQARLEYIKLDVDGFSEKNVSKEDDWGEGWRVKIDEQNGSSFLVGLGLQLSKVWNRKSSVWVPYTGIEWLQDFKANKSSVSGYFIGDPTNEKFELISDSPDDSYYKFSLGSTMVFPNGKTAFLNYSTLLSVKHNTVHSIDAGVRWGF